MEPDDQLAGLLARGGPQLEEGGVPRLDDGLRPRAAAPRRPRSARSPRWPPAQQLHAQVALEAPQALAEGRLRDVHALGRPGDAQLLRDGQEVAQVEEVRYP